jgi:hypothetical protein
MHAPAPTLTELTLVLGPPLHERQQFEAFQTLAARGDDVTEHDWARQQHAALDALTARADAISTHTLLETMVGSVLGVAVIIADVDRQWVRHADGQLYVALTFHAADVRPRAAAVALQQPDAIDALHAVASSLATLDGRAWLAWSSRSWPDPLAPEQAPRAAQLMVQIAEAVLAGHTEGDPDAPVELRDDLRRAITLGCAHADRPQLPMAQELRALRHLDPLRVEWEHVAMDAFFLAAQSIDRVREWGASPDAAGLAYLFLDRARVERLKTDAHITPRFRGEIAARTFMTAYALQRLAPQVSAALREVVGARSAGVAP